MNNNNNNYESTLRDNLRRAQWQDGPHKEGINYDDNILIARNDIVTGF